jgi:GR25 family glycosyltransferase involved in LPS biosynthesis
MQTNNYFISIPDNTCPYHLQYSHNNIENTETSTLSCKHKLDIFVINLERSTDRRKQFDEYNSKHINYTYHKAIDGKDLDINSISPSLLMKGTQKYSIGAIGCALTHLQLWEKCIEMNKPIIIFEDDIIVQKDFNQHIEHIMNIVPDKWDMDIIQLFYNFDSILSYQTTTFEKCNAIFNNTKFTKKNIQEFIHTKINTSIAKLYACFGMSAYIISPKGAKLLKDRCFPLYDRIITVPFLNNVACFTLDCILNDVYPSINAFVSVIPIAITPHTSDHYISTVF